MRGMWSTCEAWILLSCEVKARNHLFKAVWCNSALHISQVMDMWEQSGKMRALVFHVTSFEDHRAWTVWKLPKHRILPLFTIYHFSAMLLLG